MKPFVRWLVLAVALLVGGLTARWWLGATLDFLRLNSEVIQALEAVISIVFLIGGALAGWLGWKRLQEMRTLPPSTATGTNPLPEEPQVKSQEAGSVVTGGGDYITGNQTTENIGSISGGIVVVGNYNVINNSQPTVDPDALRQAYLNQLYESVTELQLAGIDPKAASESGARLRLNAVYTALLTQTREQAPDRTPQETSEQEARRLSALEQLNRIPHLVLLGDPGSGKSTFVNFTALCLAGEMLGKPEANLALLTAPLPHEEDDSLSRFMLNEETPAPQPWEHGTLLPVRAVLRDFAARGLPPVGENANASHLWDFIATELAAANLAEFAPLLDKTLHEQGGLLLVDGLDEVPEAGQRRVQIKQAVEGFARSYPKVRILVTSRTYAYQRQDWQLSGFDSVLLAPFSRGQIEQFIERWYGHIASLGRLTSDDAQGRAILLKQAILNNERLMGLAERPLLLTLMASLHAWRGGALPDKREELYADSVDLLLDSWESQSVVRGPNGELVLAQPSLVEWLKVNRQKMRNLLNELAFEAHRQQLLLTGTADVAEGDLVSGLMHLTNNPEVNTVRLVEYLRDRAGLLLPRGDGVYTFPHRTFQEYLAACYLTDHDYPDQIAGLVCADFNRWREVAMLAGAKAGRGSISTVWSLVDALCYESDHENQNASESQSWNAHLAAQVLVENVDLTSVSPRNQSKLALVRSRLVLIMEQSRLPARERSLAGDNLARLGDPRPEVMSVDSMQFCHVPAKPFQMGSRKGEKEPSKEEMPEDSVDQGEFWIGRYPVCVAQFTEFTAENGYFQELYWEAARRVGSWSAEGFNGLYGLEPRTGPNHYGGVFNLPNHPVVGVSWYEALAYCCWLKEKLSVISNQRGTQGDNEEERKLWDLIRSGQFKVSLPSEAEWEKAARGTDGQKYPWGEAFNADLANTEETGIGATNAVGCFANGTSPYGVEEMSGNVWEWTRSIFKHYPYIIGDGREDQSQRVAPRVLRGGSWSSSASLARCAYRFRSLPISFYRDYGFRVVVLPSQSEVLNSPAP